ncbi:MAG: hypothetical protein ABSB73_08290 [Solirubrobacteraceae bacterium]
MVEHSDAGAAAPRLGLALRRRDLIVLVVALAVLAAVLAYVFRGGGAIKGPGGVRTAQGGRYDGLALSSAETEPPLALRNYLGTPINIASYRAASCRSSPCPWTRAATRRARSRSSSPPTR